MLFDLVGILTFAAAVLVVLGVASVVADLVRKDRTALGRRLDEEFRAEQREEIQKSPLFRNLGQAQGEAGAGEAVEVRPPLRQRVTALIEQSGVRVTLDRLAGLTAGAGLGAAVVVGLARQSVLVGAAAGLLAAAVPPLYVYRKRRSRLDHLLRQLPDVFDLMARVVRAGQTTAQAISSVADEFDDPVAGEFGYCAEQQGLGLPPEIALRDLARRTGLLEIRIFVLALLVQQQTGGNLAEILDKLSAVVRERFRIAGKIRALTAEGRLQAIILLVLPFALMGVLMVVSRQYAEALVSNPWMVAVMASVELVGALWIRRIVRFDY